MGWLIALGIFTALMCLPLGICLRYGAAGLQLKLVFGWVTLPLPKGKKKDKKKEKKKKTPKKQKKNEGANAGTQAKPGKKGGSVTDFLPLVKIVLEFLNDFRKKLRIRRLELKLIMAGDDPCDLAINYGRTWAALGNLMPNLERYFVIQKRNLEVECDFETSETLIDAQIQLTMTVGRLLGIVLWHGIRAIKKFFDIQKLRKGGAS